MRDLLNLRDDLCGELQAINQYTRHIMESADPRVKDLLAHIRSDEKHHVVETLNLIRQLDPEQAQYFAEAGWASRP